MGNDIRSGLSFRTICFDFRSTNVGSSVIGTYNTGFDVYPLITYLTSHEYVHMSFTCGSWCVFASIFQDTCIISWIVAVSAHYTWLKIMKEKCKHVY